MAISVDDEATQRGPSIERPKTTLREQFWNLPNTITVLRCGVVPVLLLLPWYKSETGSQVIAWIFIVSALGDILDGWLARRGQQITSIGKLLDPLADKLIVSTALIVLVAVGHVPGWATWTVVVIVGRELAVTGLRGLASSQGQVMAATGYGKLKTLTQNFAIGALLFHYPTFGLPAHELGLTLLLLATALTLGSGYAYFADFFRAAEPAAPPATGRGR
jgi:CDP-diacylglycerol--glycerol-3-phosphate 3-phosphatidyltransferase